MKIQNILGLIILIFIGYLLVSKINVLASENKEYCSKQNISGTKMNLVFWEIEDCYINNMGGGISSDTKGYLDRFNYDGSFSIDGIPFTPI